MRPIIISEVGERLFKSKQSAATNKPTLLKSRSMTLGEYYEHIYYEQEPKRFYPN